MNSTGTLGCAIFGVAADDDDALKIASKLIKESGFDPVFVGPLSKARGFDNRSTPFSERTYPCRLMRLLSPIVGILRCIVDYVRHELSMSNSITTQFVSHDKVVLFTLTNFVNQPLPECCANTEVGHHGQCKPPFSGIFPAIFGRVFQYKRGSQADKPDN
jgi:hypothetical protein